MGRQKTLIKLLKRLIKQDHLYTDEKLREMKTNSKTCRRRVCRT